MSRLPLQLPPMLDYQEEALGCPARYACVEGATKAGKTFPCIVWLLREVGLRGTGDNCNFWWIAPVHETAEIAYRRLCLDMLAKADPRKLIWKSNDTDKTVRIFGKGTIHFKSAEKPDNLYGEDVFGAVVDEASRVREESWWALRSTISATGARVRFIGNVKGRKNWFYRLCQNSRNNADPEYHYAKFTADHAIAAGIMDANEPEDAVRGGMPRNVMRELYYGEPSDDGGNPFGLSHIAACVAPMSPADPVAWGVDLAKSHDWTVAIGMDEAGRTCRIKRWQAPWEVTTKELVSLIGTTPAKVDATGVGDPIVERLQRECPAVEGVKFTSMSKQQLMEGLAVAIQSGGISFPEGVIRDELESFEYVYTRTGVRYNAPDGLHDDCVCALALAVSALTFSRVDVYAGVMSMGRDDFGSDW